MRPVFTAWTLPPTALSPPPQTIDLWRADLTRCESDLQLLSIDERARAARLRIPEKARRFVAGRTLLRLILGRYLACPPEALRFSYNPHGKPLLNAEGLDFNPAHSGELFVLAVGKNGPLGIDVERIDPALDWRIMAHRVFSPAEYTALEALPPHRQRRAFYRMWTRKEAFLKGLGSGFATPGRPASPAWQGYTIPCGRHALATLAVTTAPRLIRRFVFSNSTNCP